MKNILKQVVLYILWTFRVLLPNRGGVSILMYHGVDDSGWEFSVSPKMFQRQMQYLHEHKFTFLTLEQVVNILEGTDKLSISGVVITFDDGYKGVVTEAAPILERYRIPAELFIHTDRSQKELGNMLPLLSWEDIKYLHHKAFVIESHSATHPNLKTLSRDQISHELELVELDFQKHIEHKPTFFAYPGGKYSMDAIEELRSHGYKGACTINRGRVTLGDDPFQLKRNGQGRDISWIEFLVRTSHVNDSYERLISLLK